MIWKKSFDTFYSESNLFHTYCQFSLHPFLVGRPGRIEVLSELIEYVKRHEGVWFATTDEIARRVLECASITPSVGADYGSASPSHEISFQSDGRIRRYSNRKESTESQRDCFGAATPSGSRLVRSARLIAAPVNRAGLCNRFAT